MGLLGTLCKLIRSGVRCTLCTLIRRAARRLIRDSRGVYFLHTHPARREGCTLCKLIRPLFRVHGACLRGAITGWLPRGSPLLLFAASGRLRLPLAAKITLSTGLAVADQ